MKYHITMDKQNPQITEIDQLTDKLTIRLSSEKKKQLFKFAKDNNTTVSKLIRKVINQNQTI